MPEPLLATDGYERGTCGLEWVTWRRRQRTDQRLTIGTDFRTNAQDQTSRRKELRRPQSLPASKLLIRIGTTGYLIPPVAKPNLALS